MASKKPRKRTAKDRQADARYYDKNKPKRIASERKYEKTHPATKAKKKARAKVNNAVRDGRKTKPTAAKCPSCGKTGGRREALHNAKNEMVGWGCSLCNPRGGAA